MTKTTDWRRAQSMVDDGVVLGTLMAMNAGDAVGLSSPDNAVIVDALRRSTNQLGEHASQDQVADYVRSLDPQHLEGVARNVKGIAHELAFVHAENTDGDAVTARIFPETNHTAADVLLNDQQTGHEWAVQLKATDNHAYAAHAVAAHPDIPVYATDEAVDAAHGVYASGFSDRSLEHHVASVFDGLDSSLDLPVGGMITAAGLTVIIRGALLALRAANGQPVAPGELRAAGRSALVVAARAGVLIALGATPFAPLVAGYVSARMGFAAIAMFADDAQTEPPAHRGPAALLTQGSHR